MNFTHQEKLTILNQLIQLAGADGEHRDEEYDLIHKVTEQLQLEPMETEMLFIKSIDEHYPKSEVKRITVFFYLLLMVAADGEIDRDETHLLRELSLKLALPLEAVNNSIALLDVYPNGNIPSEEIIKIFQTHHN
jgi:uncharacterized tellurite resistance protein B-like protein